ncbi:TetR/AcrR family transcriptional regulator [Nocardioides marmoriginsengisoli]|uniref:TetR/AcrR family transcriptional regulator n=1 Tax=Nocardioides marmoriginsengisoli TaxID=661483 RepID=A0A3N0CAA9_9ACTN|nr:TetR/AcrR family transcriptional regulator [Nocardioides marmoriginsengisoli]RNL60405.1 TetR/AcrR family transcriptional regulator [Nocardioides marmoriginsengisoli]
MSSEGRPRGRPPMVGRREEILDAAVEVMAIHGIEGMSLAQLAEELGLSTYALTYHFGSKEGVLAAIALHVEQRLQREFTDRVNVDQVTVGSLVRGYWTSYGNVGAAASTRLWLEIGLLASRDPERFPGFLDAMVDRWRVMVAGLLPGHPDAEEIGSIAFAVMSGLELLELARPGSVTDATLDQLVAMFENAVGT